jgi:16S rRNA (adenine1518-N6/adenine1519-N6)-dimethyltransferase
MHKPRKRFGQHFLVDPFIIERIIDLIGPQAGQHFVEIGPGQGVLTKELLARGVQLTAIEIDRDLVDGLQQTYGDLANFRVISADALETKLASITGPQKVHVVGNLPYNISTPLLNHLFSQLDNVREMTFMLQKEVVARMCAGPGTGDFGRLSIHTQTHCEVEEILHVPPSAFSPPPKVDSAIVRLVPRQDRLPPKQQEILSHISRHAFAQRRKMIKTSLREVCSQEVLLAHNIDPSARPDTLSVETFVALAKYVAKQHD